MKLLVVEGNPRSVWAHREMLGGVPYHRRFVELLHYLGYNNVDVAFPVEGELLPTSEALRQYDGILLTGSSLNIYDDVVEVTNQLDFATHCFASGVPIYGSCWGLQVAVIIAGGKIAKSINGREFGTAKAMTLTAEGKNSPFYQYKPSVFDAYCIHEDDTHQLPDNAVVLAGNAHSSCQALALQYNRSAFFGVQYHPEFIYDDIVFLANVMEDRLNKEGIFSQYGDKNAYLRKMSRHPMINDRDFHSLEIRHWLRSLETKRSI